MANTATWSGASGAEYTYYVYSWPNTFNRGEANYIFCSVSSFNTWVPIYVGETGDLSERFDNHHAISCIRSHGASHIHVHLKANQAARLAEERDLIHGRNPICNRQ